MYSLVYIFRIVSLIHFPTGPTTGPCAPHCICHRTTEGSLAVSASRMRCCNVGLLTARFQFCASTCRFHSSRAAASLIPSAAAAFMHRFAMTSDAVLPRSSNVQSAFFVFRFSTCPSTCSTSHLPRSLARSNSMYPNTSRSPALHQSYAVQCRIFL